MRRVTRSLLLLLVLSTVASAVMLASAQSPEEARREIRIVAGLAANTTLSAREVYRIVEEVARCAPLELRLDLEYSMDYLRQGYALPGFIYTKILSRPGLLGGCNASTLYQFILVMASHRVGDFFIPSNLDLARGLAMRLVTWNTSIAEGLAERVKSVEAWAAIAALGFTSRVDPRYWDLVASNREALCYALSVATLDALRAAEESRVAEPLQPGNHPLSAVTRERGWLRLVCEAGYSRLYLLLHPLAATLLTIKTGSPRHVNSLLIDNLALLASEAKPLTLYLDERLAKMPLVYADTANPRTPDEYEALCEDAYLTLYAGAPGPLGDWAILCSRDPLLAPMAPSPYANITLEAWAAWGHTVYTRLLDPQTLNRLHSETGMGTWRALRLCSTLANLHNATLAGLVARLAGIRSYDGMPVLDVIAVRVCGYRLLRGMGIPLDPDTLYAPPTEPLYAWVTGYLPGLAPPKPSPLLRDALLAWRLAVKENLTGIARSLERLAASLALGDTNSTLRYSAALAALTADPRVSELLARDAGLARLVARLAALTSNATGLAVDAEKAAGIFSRITGVPLEAALAAVTGDIPGLAEEAAKGALKPEQAARIVETLEVPPSVARRVSRLIEKVARGDEKAYVKLLELAKRLSPARQPALPRLPPPNLPAAPTPPPPLLALTAALAGAALYAARRLGFREKLGLAAGLAAALRERDPLRRNMRLILALLTIRYRVQRRPWETIREYASRLPPDARGALEEAIPLYEEARYAGRHVDKALRVLRRIARRLGLPWTGDWSRRRSS